MQYSPILHFLWFYCKQEHIYFLTLTQKQTLVQQNMLLIKFDPKSATI